MKSKFFNILIDVLDTNEIIIKCKEYLYSEKPNTIFFLNAHCFNIASSNPKYLSVLNNATLLLNDGIGLKIASYLTSVRFKENMNGTDLIPKIIRLACEERKRIYLLGSEEEYVIKAKNKIQGMYGNDSIVGFHSGYFDEHEELDIIKEINNKEVELLIIGMGVPKQEIWIHDHLDDLSGVKLFIAGGAIFDFISGKFRRAPKNMQKMGLEWLYRLKNEPRRLFGRYMIGNLVFLFNVLSKRFTIKKD